jgi:hypothetical protein
LQITIEITELHTGASIAKINEITGVGMHAGASDEKSLEKQLCDAIAAEVSFSANLAFEGLLQLLRLLGLLGLS